MASDSSSGKNKLPRGADKRPMSQRNQGRKKGFRLSLEQRIQRKAIYRKKKNMEDPVDYMLRVMRDPRSSKSRKDDMAKSAAPFIRPRLTTQKVVGGDPSKGELPLHHKFEIVLVPAKKSD